MENVGSEIGNKMRSAVKAKLLEMGTGDAAGYIDDELPDYIMIMIANKRSKSQMVVDLNLFLGSKTDLFVTWLHEVLQKLQEVTIPVEVPNPKKRTRATPKAEKEKEKKEKRPKEKKDKNLNGKTNKKQCVAGGVKACTMIDDFEGQLLQKTEKNLDITADHEHHVQKGEEVRCAASLKTTQYDFNIPTISEISSSTDVSSVRENDFSELEDIKTKKHAGKKHLKQTGDIDVHLETEAEDVINLKDDNTHRLDNANAMQSSSNTFSPNKDRSSSALTGKSIATIEAYTKRPEKCPNLLKENSPAQNDAKSAYEKKNNEKNYWNYNSTGNVQNLTKKIKSATNETIEQMFDRRLISPCMSETFKKNKIVEKRDESREKNDQSNKRSIHQRLDIKNKIMDGRESMRNTYVEVTRVNRTQRQSKELYVPSFRRRCNKDRGRERERIRGPERSLDLEPDCETRKRPSFVCRLTGNKKRRSLSSDSSYSTYDKSAKAKHGRIGSRVIVVNAKPEVSSESEEKLEINSVIRVKPRVSVSPRKQAPKNLLLRAVAEAQRSTILAKNTPKEVIKPKKPLSERLGEKTTLEGLKRTSSSTDGKDEASIFKRTTDNVMFDGKRKQHRRYINIEQKICAEDNAFGDKSEETEYVPEIGPGKSDADVLYVPEYISNRYNELMVITKYEERPKTQFVVTLSDDKTLSTYRSSSVQPQVSSSFVRNEAKCFYPSIQRKSMKSRLSVKDISSSSMSPQIAERFPKHDSTPTSISPARSKSNENTRRADCVKVYHKLNEIQKIIIQNDSDNKDLSKKKLSPHGAQRKRFKSDEEEEKSAKMEALRGLQKHQIGVESRIRKRSPINVIQNERDDGPSEAKRVSRSQEKLVREYGNECQHERESSMETGRKISIRNAEARKYENIPSLSAVALDSMASKVIKPKERCKYHPNCTKQFCEYYHPTASCKSFPTCKYGDKCMYSHPNCKYDLACSNVDCNFAHSGPRNLNQLETIAPPIASHVVPVQSYKSISAAPLMVASTAAVSGSMCKYYPNCTKANCAFVHPKICRFGKNCINFSCNYYHHDMPSSRKFKWVASAV